jgi:hypothetical protein
MATRHSWASFPRVARNMSILTPKHRATLWVAANILLIAVVPAAACYFDRELRAGSYPVDADSIGIPIVGLAMNVLTLLLPLNIGCWLLLRRYPGKVPLSASARGLRLGPRLVAGLVLTLAAACAVAAVWALADGAPEIAAVLLLWCCVTLAIQTAFVESVRFKRPPDSGSLAIGDCG